MLFSIIVPIYKVEQFLPRCIDSILAQTFDDYEVILVDDGSPDSCSRICDAYEKKDPRIQVIHKPNGGLVSARNAGIFAAKGDYITYVDGDDWIKPNLLQFVYDRLAESTVPLDMILFASENVCSDHVEYTVNNLPEGYYDRNRLEREVFPYLFSDRRKGFFIGSVIMGHTWNKPCRRELQLEYYVRDERIRMFTDVPMTYECLLNCNNIYICNEPLYLYNKMNENSILAIGKKNYLTESFRLLVEYMQERMIGHYGPMIDRQLNDYPAHLIIRTAIWEIRKERTFLEAVKKIKNGLKTTGMLRYVHLKGLPLNPAIFIMLLKMHLYIPAMMLCAIKAKHSTFDGQ